MIRPRGSKHGRMQCTAENREHFRVGRDDGFEVALPQMHDTAVFPRTNRRCGHGPGVDFLSGKHQHAVVEFRGGGFLPTRRIARTPIQDSCRAKRHESKAPYRQRVPIVHGERNRSEYAERHGHDTRDIVTRSRRSERSEPRIHGRTPHATQNGRGRQALFEARRREIAEANFQALSCIRTHRDAASFRLEIVDPHPTSRSAVECKSSNQYETKLRTTISECSFGSMQHTHERFEQHRVEARGESTRMNRRHYNRGVRYEPE